MILYHGTDKKSANDIIEKINLAAGNHPVDFGPGFYMAVEEDSAISWANRKAFPCKGYIVSAKLKDITTLDLKIKEFGDLDSNSPEYLLLEWAQFVINNRCGENYINGLHQSDHNLDGRYDLVIGPIADGDVVQLSKTCKKQRRLVTLEEAKSMLSKQYGKQYVFCSINSLTAIDGKLKKKEVQL